MNFSNFSALISIHPSDSLSPQLPVFSDQLWEQNKAEAEDCRKAEGDRCADPRGGPASLRLSYSWSDHPEGRAMWLPSALLLLCVPGSLSLRGPSTVMGAVGGSLSVQCQYEEEYKTFDKYWCRQPCLPLFSEIVKTSGSKGEVRSSRVSIMDQPGNLTFTVTLENLTEDDAGKYWCGIATLLQEDGLSGFLPDPLFQVQVLVSPASSSESSAGTPGSARQDLGSPLSSVHFLLLVFLKVPLFLSMLCAVLWMNRLQRTS